MDDRALPPPTTLEKAAWCAFDFANSSFVTIIITVVYPRYFLKLGPNPQEGELAWAWAMITSLAIALVLSPLLGAMADQKARKKRFLLASWLLCVVCCAGLSFAGPGALIAAWILVVLANIGFSAGENLIAAFLPELATPSEMGRLSGIGWAVGYFGGLASLAVALPLVGDATRWVPLATAGFFLVAGLPTFLLLRERAHPRSSDGRAVIAAAFAELRRTFGQRKALPDLFRLLLCLFLEQAGVSIVIAFAAIYAAVEFQLSDKDTILLFIGLQVAAAAGAALFGFIQDRIGGKRALVGTIFVWLVAVGFTLLSHSIAPFCVGAAIAGIAMGSSQASGRAMVGTFTPPERQGEWFGLWGIAMKGAGVTGVLAYALVRSANASMRAAMGTTAVFFVASLIVLASVDEKRGMAAAASENADVEPIAGPASTYRHPDYLDEEGHANIARAADARLDLCDIGDEQALVSAADSIRPVLESWVADPARILPYPVDDHHWQHELGATVLAAFGASALPPSRIFFGDGAYELWKELCGFVLRKGVLLGAGPVYPEFAGYFTAAGGRFRALSDEDGGFPADRVIEALDRDRDVVAIYADLPYNATGCWPARDRVLGVIEAAAQRDVLVIIDEAYANFLGTEFTWLPDVARHENLVVIRSLSKGYGLRGIRFAWIAAGARVAAVLGQIRSPYAPSQPAAQIAAHVLRTAPGLVRPLASAVASAKARVLGAASQAGLLARPTHPNAPNLMLRSPAGDLAARLAGLGVRVTKGTQFAFTAPGLSADVRMRVPLREARIALLLEALDAIRRRPR